MTVMLIVWKREKLEERESVFKWCLRLETQRDSPCLPQPSPHTPARTHTHTCSGPTGLLGLPAAQVSSWDTVSSKCKFGAHTRACTLGHTQTHACAPRQPQPFQVSVEQIPNQPRDGAHGLGWALEVPVPPKGWLGTEVRRALGTLEVGSRCADCPEAEVGEDGHASGAEASGGSPGAECHSGRVPCARRLGGGGGLHVARCGSRLGSAGLGPVSFSLSSAEPGGPDVLVCAGRKEGPP